MKKILFIFLFTNLIYGQEIAKKPFKIKPEIGLSITTQVFQGNNYLSKGHKNPSFGGELKLNLVHYNNFKLGGTLEKSTLKVSDFSIGGNSDKTNINSASVILSYQFQMTNKLNLIPQVSYGGVELRQKNGSKLFIAHRHSCRCKNNVATNNYTSQ